MDLSAVALQLPADSNLIAGQAHFIKTVEDLAEIVVTTVPGARFGLAFCEASGPCLIRTEGNDPELVEAAAANAGRVAAGHTFFLLLRSAYPINLLNAVKLCPEVGRLLGKRDGQLGMLGLEHEIDQLNGELSPLTSFVLPGGSPASAALHQARTVCRRAERVAVALAETDVVSAPALKYLNRLSDLLFVAARWTNAKGAGDILWTPGATR